MFQRFESVVRNNTGVSHGLSRLIAASCLALVMVVGLTVQGCKKGGGFGDKPLDPSTPPPGLDTSQKQMIDGVGTPGPVRARLQSIKPDLNSQVLPAPAVFDPNGKCTQSSPFSCFAFLAEVCVDSFANPGNRVLLQGMRVAALFSADGTNPLFNPQFGIPAEVQPSPNGQPIVVSPGSCTSIETPENLKAQYPSSGQPRFFMLVATYGGAPAQLSPISTACPTPETITANLLSPGQVAGCAFRTVYDLGYHF